MKYVLFALSVLVQHKGTSAASLKIKEGIIESIKEKLDANITPSVAEKQQISALIPQLQYPELKDELLKLIER